MAATTGFKVTFNKAALKAIAAAPVVALNRLAEAAVAEAVKKSPFQTGTNRRSIQWDAPDHQKTRRIFTTSGYGGFLEIGTGLFGPKRKRIVPKTKKVLHWGGPSGPFVKSVAGRPPTPYMRPAIDAVKNRAASILKGVVPDDGSA